MEPPRAKARGSLVAAPCGGQSSFHPRPKGQGVKKRWIKKLVNNGAEGIVLGCTELPSLIKPEDSDVPLFDTTHIHALAILDYAMGKREKQVKEVPR